MIDIVTFGLMFALLIAVIGLLGVLAFVFNRITGILSQVVEMFASATSQ